jgi:hypothetical protein
MKRSLLLGLVLTLSTSCKIMFDGGRPNIIPLPQDTSRPGERPNSADNALSNADFPAPWNTVSLPYGNAEIISVDEHHIELSYKNNKLESTATSYDSYMRVHGWSSRGHTQTENTRAHRYYHEGHEAGFLVTWTAPDDLNVVVEMFDGSDNKVRAAFGETGAAPAAGH